jgi:hypothetical protein
MEEEPTPAPMEEDVKIKPSASASQSKPAIKPDPSQSKPYIPELSLLDDDSEPEPDTEDEDDAPPTTSTSAAAPSSPPTVELDELNYLDQFVSVRNDMGVEIAVKSLIELVGKLVEKSFSTQNYDKGVKALRRAREEARSVSRRFLPACTLPPLARSLFVSPPTSSSPNSR